MVINQHPDVESFFNISDCPLHRQECPALARVNDRQAVRFGKSNHGIVIPFRRAESVGDLVRRQEPELLEFRNFGKKSLTEIQDILKAMGLNLGMKVDTKKLRTK